MLKCAILFIDLEQPPKRQKPLAESIADKERKGKLYYIHGVTIGF